MCRTQGRNKQGNKQASKAKQGSKQERKLCPAAGTNSYVLFTLDKLVSKTVKQLQLVHSDDVAAKLVELWRYENARGVEVRDARGAGRGSFSYRDAAAAGAAAAAVASTAAAACWLC